MPFAPKIRKDILQALDTVIIPALWNKQVALGYVAPPLHFPQNITTRLLHSTIPTADAHTPGYPVQARWSQEHLHSTHHPYLSFIYEGAADERTILTAEQADQYRIAEGIYALRWTAPAALVFPAGMPHNMGSKYFWDEPSAACSTARILQFFLYDEILVHTTTRSQQGMTSSHSLRIKDELLYNLAEWFCRELRNAAVNSQDTAHALLLAFMVRMHSYLHSHPAVVVNTSYPFDSPRAASNDRNYYIWQEAANFIQMHLNENLTVPDIAHRS